MPAPLRFRPGDRVVCIDAAPPLTTRDAPALVRGRVYTVLRASHGDLGHPGGPEVGGLHLLGAEFDEASHQSWRADRFRKAT